MKYILIVNIACGLQLKYHLLCNQNLLCIKQNQGGGGFAGPGSVFGNSSYPKQINKITLLKWKKNLMSSQFTQTAYICLHVNVF